MASSIEVAQAFRDAAGEDIQLLDEPITLLQISFEIKSAGRKFTITRQLGHEGETLLESAAKLGKTAKVSLQAVELPDGAGQVSHD